MRTVRSFAACFVAIFALVTVALSSTRAQVNSQKNQSSGNSFRFWTAAPSNYHAGSSPGSPDNWLGGTGNWSNGADWSAGEPGTNSDVVINTGNDVVVLDTSANINSLTLGGNSGSSELESPNLGGQDMTIAGSLTINQSGTLLLESYSNVVANADSSNAGTVILSQSRLQINGNFSNSGFIQTAAECCFSTLSVSGNFTNTSAGSLDLGMLNDTLSVGGTLTNLSTSGGGLFAWTVDVGGLLNNAGGFAVISGQAGSLSNSGDLAVFGEFSVGGNAMNSGTIMLSPEAELVGFGVIGTLTNTSTGQITMDQGNLGAGSLVNSGNIQLTNSQIHIGSNVANSGTIALNTNNDQTSSVGGQFTNSAGGRFQLYSGNTANVGFMTNAGSISVGDGATLNVTGGSHAPSNAIPGFLNSGIVDIAQGGTLLNVLTYTQTAGQTTVDGTLQVAGRGIANFAGGALYGDGTIAANTISNAEFNIGDMPMTVGQLAITGNYTQGANGSLTFDIASLSSYDQLNVSGRASLNGLAMINLLNGYIPQVGNMFDIMNFASSSGTFSMVVGLPINGSEHFVLEYNPTNLTLDVAAGPSQQASSGHGSGYFEPYVSDVTSGSSESNLSNLRSPASVPEPGSLVLFGSGVAGIAAMLRRKSSLLSSRKLDVKSLRWEQSGAQSTSGKRRSG